MDHVAIDLGGINSQVCVMSSVGELLLERKVARRKLGDFLARREASVVVLETCSEAMAVADAAKACGHDVRVVPATLVRSLGVGARGIKTDERDARALCIASCRVELRSVHVPSPRARELKHLLGSRDALIQARTQLCNHVKGFLRQKLLRVRATPSKLPEATRLLLSDKPGGVPGYIEGCTVRRSRFGCLRRSRSSATPESRPCDGPLSRRRKCASSSSPLPRRPRRTKQTRNPQRSTPWSGQHRRPQEWLEDVSWNRLSKGGDHAGRAMAASCRPR
jgi:hypothetical protein